MSWTLDIYSMFVLILLTRLYVQTVRKRGNFIIYSILNKLLKVDKYFKTSKKKKKMNKQTESKMPFFKNLNFYDSPSTVLFFSKTKKWMYHIDSKV